MPPIDFFSLATTFASEILCRMKLLIGPSTSSGRCCGSCVTNTTPIHRLRPRLGDDPILDVLAPQSFGIDAILFDPAGKYPSLTWSAMAHSYGGELRERTDWDT